MHIVGRSQTSGGFNTKVSRISGKGVGVKKLGKYKTKGSGMTQAFYENAQTMEDPTKNYSPANVKKFDKIKIKGSKPKNYITF